jgi:hypothetical protein
MVSTVMLTSFTDAFADVSFGTQQDQFSQILNVAEP